MTQENNKKVFEKFNASTYAVGIVVAGFNITITEKLLDSAKECLRDYGVKEKNIRIEWVPGSVEIPLVLHSMAKTKKYKALVALGAIIRGETAHFDFVAKAVTEGVLRVQLDNSIPVGFGVLTVDTKKQAIERLDSGYGATEAALHSAKVISSLKKK